MKLYIDQHNDDYNPLQDPFYHEKINAILQNFAMMERHDKDFDAMSHPDFPEIRHFRRLCASRPRPLIKSKDLMDKETKQLLLNLGSFLKIVREEARHGAAVTSCPAM